MSPAKLLVVAGAGIALVGGSAAILILFDHLPIPWYRGLSLLVMGVGLGAVLVVLSRMWLMLRRIDRRLGTLESSEPPGLAMLAASIQAERQASRELLDGGIQLVLARLARLEAGVSVDVTADERGTDRAD